MDIEFEYNSEKNSKLIEERGIGFDAIIYYINQGCLLDIVEHPNQSKYSGQSFYVVDVDGYVYLVPFVRKDHQTVFLKTIFPSRKHTKQYLNKMGKRGGKSHG